MQSLSAAGGRYVLFHHLPVKRLSSTGSERATALNIGHTDHELFVHDHAIQHSPERLIVDRGGVNAGALKLGAQILDRACVVVVHIGIMVQDAAFDHLDLFLLKIKAGILDIVLPVSIETGDFFFA